MEMPQTLHGAAWALIIGAQKSNALSSADVPYHFDIAERFIDEGNRRAEVRNLAVQAKLSGHTMPPILADMGVEFSEDGSAHSLTIGQAVVIENGTQVCFLNGNFTPQQLRALAWWKENKTTNSEAPEIV